MRRCHSAHDMSPESSSPAPVMLLLRLALGYVYVYFGLIKFYPDLSPAEMIASQTVMRLSLHWLDARTAMQCLAWAECLIGIGFLFNVLPRLTLCLFTVHIAGTFVPLFVLPELMFKIAPFAPTLEGEFIFKNLVLLAAGFAVLLPSARRPRREPSTRSEPARSSAVPALAPQNEPPRERMNPQASPSPNRIPV